MFGFDNSNEYIDWWHDVLPDSLENFEHKGTMASSILTPSVTIGLSNYINISLSQVIGTDTCSGIKMNTYPSQNRGVEQQLYKRCWWFVRRSKSNG